MVGHDPGLGRLFHRRFGFRGGLPGAFVGRLKLVGDSLKLSDNFRQRFVGRGFSFGRRARGFLFFAKNLLRGGGGFFGLGEPFVRGLALLFRCLQHGLLIGNLVRPEAGRPFRIQHELLRIPIAFKLGKLSAGVRVP